MASVAKFTLQDSPRLLAHCNRTLKRLGEHIDAGRTQDNYNLCHRTAQKKTDYQFAKSRVKADNVRMLDRDNVNALCSWVVTLPKDMCHESVGKNGEDCYAPNDPEESRRFFQCAYDFFAKKHGEENVVSAYVHMDENCPHMHFIFTPIVKDKKHGGYKVSAKEALTGCYGVEFQVALQDYISKEMGREVNFVKKENLDYERNVKQLKKQTLNAKCVSLSRQAKREEENLERLRRSVRIEEKAADAKAPDIKAASANGYTAIRDQDWEYVKKQMKTLAMIRAERDAARKELEELEAKTSVLEVQALMEKNAELEKQVSSLSAQRNNLQAENKSLRSFMEELPVRGRTALSLYEEKTGYARHQDKTEYHGHEDR